MDISLPIATQAEAEAGTSTTVLMTPQRTAQAIAALAPTSSGGGGSVYGRTYLTSDASLYVSASGNDTTGDGSVGNPWATVAKAYSYAQRKLDLAGERTVTCYLASDYSTNDIIEGPLVGARGPQNFLIRGTASDNSRLHSGSIYAQNGAQCRLNYMQVQPTGGTAVTITDGVVEFGGININTYGAGGIFNIVGPRSKLRMVSDCTLVGVGSCRHVFIAEDHGQIEIGFALYIAGAPSWTMAFCQGDLGGLIDGTGFSYSGGYPSGSRYTAALNGIVWTGTGTAPANFYPGSSAGTSTGGIYA